MQLGVGVVIAVLVPEEPVGQNDDEAAVVSEQLVEPARPERRVVNAFMLEGEVVNNDPRRERTWPEQPTGSPSTDL